ncbi:FkbM family methyltransferase [Tateyamaria sp. SN6-1]|uniref:FkbM family methyltransferase n=1 Tax=Tateyamaria sp. SN6-1 TaxID=3092148 RepID=UPI0039F5A41F
MTDRVIPTATRPKPKGLFEQAMALGRHLPGTPGHICYRKLKRRLCANLPDTFGAVLADTRAGDLCIDLGANVGDITRQMAATGADVICFEPDPAAFAALEANTATLSNVTLHPKAASTSDTRMMLRRSTNWEDEDALSHTVASSIARVDKDMSDAQGVMVDVVDLPAFLHALDRDIRILKMDIEGAEWDLLQALLDHPVLARIDCIFVETHERYDPVRCIPLFERLQDRAEAMARPYINLYWV